MHTPTMILTSNTVKEPVNALVPVTPTEITSPLLVDLVQRYKHFARASAENIVELAKTLATAKSALSPEEHKMFCHDVGLNPKSSTYRKLTVIGDKAARFEPHLARMPAAWTTVYKLAKLSDEKFDDVAKNDRFSPFMTAKSITAIVEPKPSAIRARVRTRRMCQTQCLNHPRMIKTKPRMTCRQCRQTPS